jgi:hypothetical protein
MLWRIGDVLDFDQQLAWTRAAGFDGVGFHASGGAPDQWQGIEPARCGAAERRRLMTFSHAAARHDGSQSDRVA